MPNRPRTNICHPWNNVDAHTIQKMNHAPVLKLSGSRMTTCLRCLSLGGSNVVCDNAFNWINKLVSGKPNGMPPVSELQLLCPGCRLITVDAEPDRVQGGWFWYKQIVRVQPMIYAWFWLQQAVPGIELDSIPISVLCWCEICLDDRFLIKCFLQFSWMMHYCNKLSSASESTQIWCMASSSGMPSCPGGHADNSGWWAKIGRNCNGFVYVLTIQ